MRARALLTLTALLPAIGLTTGATEDSCRNLDPADSTSAVVCETALFMQCPADDAEKVVAPTSHIQLEEGAPDRSYQDGAGCGTVDEPVFGSTTMGPNAYEYSATGWFVGNVDTATFELHFLGPGIGQLGEDISLDTRVTVDGQSMFGSTETIPVNGDPVYSPKRHRIVPEIIQSSTGASVALRFTVTGISDFLDSALDGEDVFHTVGLTVNTPHGGNCQALPPNNAERCIPAGGYALVWGATEIASGVTFNVADDTAFGTEVVAEDKENSV